MPPKSGLPKGALPKSALPKSALPKGARRTTPSPETLAALGPDRLIGLVLAESARNPAFRKLVSAALAALQGPGAVAAIVDRRLTALENARGFIDWQKRRAFVADLDATVSVILAELRPLDPEAALERLVRFLAGADAVLGRVDDGAGTAQGVYERAAQGAIETAAGLEPEAMARFAAGLVPRLAADPFGALAELLGDLIPRLPEAALPGLDAALAAAAGPGAAGARADGPGGAREAAWRREARRAPLLRARQAVAERRGDVDGFIALDAEIRPGNPDRAGIAALLLAAGRPAQALDWVRRPPPRGGIHVLTREDLILGLPPTRPGEGECRALEPTILDALGRGAEAQGRRWALFRESLDGRALRDHLAKLPDFEDEEALERALDHAVAFPDPHRGLAFLVAWPDLARAARLVEARARDLDGERYAILAPAAEALAADHPLAATILYRLLLDDILGLGRSQAYGHGARYLRALDALAVDLPSGGSVPDPETYRAALRKAHGRKYGFWGLVDGA